MLCFKQPAFFLSGSDAGYFCFLCRFSVSVWGLFIYKLISVLCSMKCHHFWGLLLRCLVPASCHSWFVSIWALWLDVLQELSPSALFTFELAVPLIYFCSFLCFRHDTWGGREITYWLQALITHLAELFFKTDHVCPTVCLKVLSLSWGDGCVCWRYLENLGKWRELSALLEISGTHLEI